MLNQRVLFCEGMKSKVVCGFAVVLLCSCGSGSSPEVKQAAVVSEGCETRSTESGYCLVWNDEFQSSKVDMSKWSFEKNCWGGGNGEAQCYVSDSKNVWVDGEFLHIKALRENVTGPNIGDDEDLYDPKDRSGKGTYSSGRIRTKNKGDWRYGRFEIRAKLPAGQGTWPAIWMLPTDWVFGGWASSGEIDIMEAVNLGVGGERQVHGTLHFGNNYPNNVYSGEAYLLPNQENPADDFHEYAIEWQKGEIRWYVDGDHYATQTEAGWYSTAALNDSTAPFNQRFHMILNLAVGGDWAGNTNDKGIDESVFPQEMIVDYVRVYECSKDPESGKGCKSSDGQFIKNAGVKPPVSSVVDVAAMDLVVFDGVITEPYEWHTWTAEGSVGYRITDVGGAYGSVAEITYNTNEGIGYFQSVRTADLSAFKNVEFDLRVVSDTREDKAGLVFRADCIHPCSSGNYAIGYPGLNVWKHYSISMSDLVGAGLNAALIDTPFVIAPPIGNEKGVVLQVDNVILSL